MGCESSRLRSELYANPLGTPRGVTVRPGGGLVGAPAPPLERPATPPRAVRPATPPRAARQATPMVRPISPTHRLASPSRTSPPRSGVVPPNALRPLTPKSSPSRRNGSPVRATAPSLRGASVGSTVARAHGSHRDDGSVPTVDAMRFRHGRPTAAGTVTPCFKKGLLYRIVHGEQWYFYNDTQEYEMHVRYRFGCDSSVRPLSGAALTREGDELVVTTVVYPGETQPFMEGQYSGYHSTFRARPLSEEYRTRTFETCHHKADSELTHELQSVVGPASNDPEAVLLAMLRAWKPFVDPSFRPSPSSQFRHIDTRTLPMVPWLRPEDYLPQDKLDRIAVGSSVRPTDVDVGLLGDSWVTSALAALAERPEMVRRLLRHPHSEDLGARERAVGAYRVWVHKGGWWRVCLIDNYFPCVGRRPCYAGCVDPFELWPSLIQKAYAKVHGSYAAIIGGDVLQALHDLSGFPTTRFDTAWGMANASEEEADRVASIDMFEYLQRRLEDRAIVVLNTPPTDLTDRELQQQHVQRLYAAAGLQQGFAYTVLNAKHFPQHGIRLVQVRNPWHYLAEAWTGAWSREDELWTRYPDISAECPTHDPSTMWIAWRDALDLFDGGGVCHTREGWSAYNVRGAFEEGIPTVALEVVAAAPTRTFVTLSQNDRRGLPPDDPDTHYIAAAISVCRPQAQGSQYVVDANSSTDAVDPTEEIAFNYARDVSLAYTFEPQHGPYLVVPRVYDASSKAFVLSLLTEGAKGKGMSVTIRQLDAKCAVFHNVSSFAHPTVAHAVESDVQRIIEGNCTEVVSTAL